MRSSMTIYFVRVDEGPSTLFHGNGPLARYVKLRVAHAPGMPGTLQRKPLVSEPGMHHGTCVTHVPWCTSRLLARGGGENVPGIPGACAIRNVTYLARSPLAMESPWRRHGIETLSALWAVSIPPASSSHKQPLLHSLTLSLLMAYKNCKNEMQWNACGPMYNAIIVRRAGLLWSQQDFEWRWSVPLFKCLTVLEFSFILFDLCLLITFFNFIMNYVPIVTFLIFTYHKIWILSIMFCFIWSYWIIYFLACLEVSWRVVS